MPSITETLLERFPPHRGWIIHRPPIGPWVEQRFPTPCGTFVVNVQPRARVGDGLRWYAAVRLSGVLLWSCTEPRDVVVEGVTSIVRTLLALGALEDCRSEVDAVERLSALTPNQRRFLADILGSGQRTATAIAARVVRLAGRQLW